MKRIAIILAVLLFVLCGCAQRPFTTEPTTKPTAPTTTPEPVDELDLVYWAQFSDYELLEKAIKSETMAFRQLSAVYMTAEEWKDYVLAHCTPIRALMLRDTALASMEEHAADLAEKYQDEPLVRAENFVLFVVTLRPEMQQQFPDFEYQWPPRSNEA